MAEIDTRDKLIDALSQAAELEHLLCCSYLYAGFSLKKVADDSVTLAQTETTRGWATQIMLIARQEMEHLGMACNLLSAIGGAANFYRANYPQEAKYYPLEMPFQLKPFSLETLMSFIEFEMPDWLKSETGVKKSGDDPLIRYKSLQQLYEQIHLGFVFLNGELGPEKLFVGPTSAQITNETLFQQVGKAYQVNLNGVQAKDPADRLAEVEKIIDQIIREGEGTPPPPKKAVNPQPSPDSHYARFVKIREEYLAILAIHKGFQPAKPLISNPQTFHHGTGGKATPLTAPFTLEVAGLFNMVYEAMLLLLIRFYSQTNETPTELSALQEIAFFPLMTMGIRPLGEVLTELPVGDNEPDKLAGPPFEISRPLNFIPHKEVAWKILHELLTLTGSEASRLAQKAEQDGLPVAERLRFISMSLIRNAENFGAYIKGKENI